MSNDFHGLVVRIVGGDKTALRNLCDTAIFIVRTWSKRKKLELRWVASDMNHNEVTDRDVLEGYLKQELSNEEEAAFEEHLLHCKICSDNIKMLKMTINGIESIQLDKFRLKIDNSDKKSDFIHFLRKPAVRYAAAIVTLAVISGVFSIIFQKKYTNEETPVIGVLVSDSLNNLLAAEAQK